MTSAMALMRTTGLLEASTALSCCPAPCGDTKSWNPALQHEGLQLVTTCERELKEGSSSGRHKAVVLNMGYTACEADLAELSHIAARLQQHRSQPQCLCRSKLLPKHLRSAVADLQIPPAQRWLWVQEESQIKVR